MVIYGRDEPGVVLAVVIRHHHQGVQHRVAMGVLLHDAGRRAQQEVHQLRLVGAGSQGQRQLPCRGGSRWQRAVVVLMQPLLVSLKG